LAIVVVPGLRSDIDTIHAVPSLESWIAPPDARPAYQPGIVAFPLPPFARSASWASRDGRIVVGSNDRFEIDEIDRTGRLPARYRVPALDLPISAAVYDSAANAMVADGMLPGWDPGAPGVVAAGVRPGFDQMFLGADGALWLSPYRFASDRELWNVLDASGQWLGSTRLPANFRPTDFGGGWVLGVWRDEYQVEYVRMHTVTRPPG
jgi:hypothetical protein